MIAFSIEEELPLASDPSSQNPLEMAKD